MNKWKVKYDDNEEYFDNFESGVRYFRKKIQKYIKTNKDIFPHDCMPFQPGVFFYYKHDDGTINDEEIVVEQRITRLLNSFNFSEDALIDYVSKVLIKDINYEGTNNEFKESLKVSASIKEKEISLELIHLDTHDGVGETHLLTNAFIFEDSMKKYYFDSHQIIIASDDINNLGKSIDFNIVLSYE